MNKKDDKRGFSGLSDLSSGAGALQQAQSPPNVSPQRTVFLPLDLTKQLTLPALWSSVDAGETWIWEDFFLTFQKGPKTVLDVTMEMQGQKPVYQGMIYHYAMTVFYRMDKNPSGPSHVPIMTVALEQADLDVLAKLLGSEASGLLQSENGSKMGPVMLGLFTKGKHSNFGEYKGDISSQAVKQIFFSLLGQHLRVSGQPRMIGDLADAFGHPETGLPARKKNSGCAPLILLSIGIGSLGVLGLTFI